MNTTRNKRWNGKIETLTTGYLDNVIEKMGEYGDRVQFGLTGTGLRPHYQIINSANKFMAFDSNNHLLHPTEHEFVGVNASPIFSLEQIKAAKSGVSKTAVARVSRVVTGGVKKTAAAKAQDIVNAAKYEYFKNNRGTLPEEINKYSDNITVLMQNGMSAEDAFGEVVKQHF
ncbi:MAG: transaldolase family protein [Glaciimonas sp.]|nr:transaldolase family protein [Glaciimonas sp.]